MEVQDRFSLHRRFLTFYKKDTLALFFCFLLTFMLAGSMLILLHTNHRTRNIEYKTMFTPSDCLIEDVSGKQAVKLREDHAVSHLALSELSNGACSKNRKAFYLQKGDENFITMMAAVVKGKLPETAGEIAAEKWVLLNLGVEPVLGEKFDYQAENGRTETGIVTGILSDMRGNVDYGVLNVYTVMGRSEKNRYTAYLTFKEDANYEHTVRRLRSELGIAKGQVRKCPAREDFKELFLVDLQVMSVIIFVCLVVFYGIYKIILAAREKQYGILRALGMDRRQMQGMLLLELYRIYLCGMPAGIAAGVCAAAVITHLSGEAGTVVYLYNESVRYRLILPVRQIAVCAAVVAVLCGTACLIACRGFWKKTALAAIAGTALESRNRLHVYGIRSRTGKIQTLFSLSCGYLLRNLRLSLFVMLTMVTGITLFTGLLYQTWTLQTYRADTKEQWYLNGQYEMSLRGFDTPYQGVPVRDLKKISKLKGVEDIKTSAGMRIRVIDEDGIGRNHAYYEHINAQTKKYLGYELRGHDGTNQIYKTSLFGYNTSALKELEKYVVSGSFHAETIAEDQIILAIPSMDPTKKDDTAVWYQDGERLMDYQAGDTISIKYRADFKTNTQAYETLKDCGTYLYRTYQVAAVVSFEYMRDCNRDVYPRLITSDRMLRKIVPDGCFQCIYIHTAGDLSASNQKKLERELIRIGAESAEVSTRSLAGNIRQNEMFYRKQMVYLYGIALTAFVLILIQIANNLRFRMYIRTREICMLRAVGMSVAMARGIFFMENTMLALASAIAAYFISHPVVRYLYQQSDLKVYGHPFTYRYAAFFTVSVAAAVLCMVLSVNIVKSWKTKRIAQVM